MPSQVTYLIAQIVKTELHSGFCQVVCNELATLIHEKETKEKAEGLLQLPLQSKANIVSE